MMFRCFFLDFSMFFLGFVTLIFDEESDSFHLAAAFKELTSEMKLSSMNQQKKNHE
jgi:hypothetical protein